MSKVIFGVWDGEVIDNRDKRMFEIEDSPRFDNFVEFNPGNPIKAFFGWKGFFIFDGGVNLLDAAMLYITRAAKESCGACTPCRVGTNIIKQKLADIINGVAGVESLDELELLAEHVRTTSLCGLGQTATVALQKMLTYFRQELEAEIRDIANYKRQEAYSYVTAPCIEACPAKVEVPRYIDYIQDGKLTHSVSVILQKYPMAETCGRVCVRFCEFACRRNLVDEPVGIKLLKRFVAEREKYISDNWFDQDLIADKKPDDLKVAIIGTGPAGINAAYHLLLKGYSVDIFEAHSEPGGMASVGIPNYRLPSDVLHKEIGIVETLGGKIYYNQRMGKDFTLTDLKKRGYKAFFLGIGAGTGKMIGIPGEQRSMKGYKSGINFLLYINHYYLNIGLDVDLGNKMVIVGGGNVAMDCARSALRMGSEEVHLVYRRSKDEMPADHEEIEAAEKEGVIFHFLTHPVQIVSKDNQVTGLKLIKMELGEPDAGGRRSAKPVDGSEYTMDCDFIIPAIGQRVDHSFLSPNDGIELNKWGLIDAEPHTLETTQKGVFAGGDCTTGPKTLIEAMALGMKAAKSIDDYLTHGRVLFDPSERMSELIKDIEKDDTDYLAVPVRATKRIIADEIDPEVRKKIFEEVEKNITVEQAYEEASRCLRCYRVSLAITEK
ncbi:MAG: FAD-dependent oxidoreductase [Spirochaetales bacterium]|nr:FAD-dependent oxidoreductase [Spirochaetales bacterium]